MASPGASGAGSGATVPFLGRATAALLLAAVYYAGTRIGFALTFHPEPISIFWPPNALLMAALLLAPSSWWLPMLLVALVAHFLAQTASGVPHGLVFGWYVSNCAESMIGVLGMRRCLGGERVRLDSSRHVILFLFICVFLAPFVTSFLDAGFVHLSGWREIAYWDLWRMRFFSNVLAILLIVPVVLAFAPRKTPAPPVFSFTHWLEGALLVFALALASVMVFATRDSDGRIAPVVLYAPLPMLLWAAVRFGPAAAALTFLATSAVVITGAVNGLGPFVDSAPTDSALSIQIFLISVGIPMHLLAAEAAERRDAQQALQRKQEELRMAMETVKLETWGRELVASTGRTENIGADLLDTRILPEDRERVLHDLDRAIRENRPCEYEFRVMRPDGEKRTMLGKVSVVRDTDGMPARLVGINVDITEHKQAEASAHREAMLRDSEARFRQIADTIPQIVWAARPDGHVDYANRKWQELTGDPAQPDGDASWLPYLHPDDRASFLEKWHVALSGASMFETEYRLLSPAWRDYRWQLVRAMPVTDETGSVVRWYGTATDIDDRIRAERELKAVRDDLERRVADRTSALRSANQVLEAEVVERRRAEEALRKSEERLSQMFRLSPDAMIVTCGTDGRVLDVNERWEMLFGYNRDEAIGRTARELAVFTREQDAELLCANGRSGRVRDREMALRGKSGELRQVVLSGEEIWFSDDACFIAVIRDITEQKLAERNAQSQRDQLAHLTRVVLLGELSGAIAHELNQPLTAILINARIASRALGGAEPKIDEVREILDDIVAENRRAGDIIRRLRALFTRSDPVLRPLDINEIIRETLSLAHSDLIARNITVRVLLDTGLAQIDGDRVQLQQVMLNLIVNACEAMHENPPARRQLTLETAPGGDDRIQIRVSDTGHGLPSAAASRVFEPFFTTKTEGLGLGLSISRTIITGHRGQIEASNNAEGGATFRITLPVYTSQIALDDEDRNRRVSGG